MTGVHIHLLVNHVPILGALFALLLLLAAYRWAPDTLTRTALIVLVGVALAAAASNYSGEPAEDAIRRFPGVQRALIHDHEEMGEWAFRLAVIVGIAAIVVLARNRRTVLPSGVRTAFTVAALVVSGFMGYVGLLGGRVRHTEVRPGATAADAIVVESLPPRQRPPGEEGER